MATVYWLAAWIENKVLQEVYTAVQSVLIALFELLTLLFSEVTVLLIAV